ncbi:hypothetical protein FE257_009874 [Aspergillus nanangensis]|uniref:DSBA-like thioredoxin domain-containing protein n=1 Tax=Aspergillus nanangensis TaxID=2582783 RepID=A0AAD4CWB2_ASPNN|nr:hypothetical protein FE257_009874 [Aspergillus nanangensis]
MSTIQIDIISDPICPWCYIGYRSLQRAITLYQKTYPGGSKDTFQITWKPYFIDQSPPTEPELIQDRMVRRMQDPKQVAAAQTRLKRVGMQVGLQLKFGGYIGSSRTAHRILYLVQEEKGSEMQSLVAERLFHFQFEREMDVSDEGVVVQAAVQAGLDEEEVRGWLASGRGQDEVEEEQRAIRASGEVRGVPHFVVGGERHLEGAEDFTEFLEAFVAVRNQD